MSDIVQKLWGFCHTLRHDGIDYGDYIEQITYLLFLKMADERVIDLSALSFEEQDDKDAAGNERRTARGRRCAFNPASTSPITLEATANRRYLDAASLAVEGFASLARHDEFEAGRPRRRKP